MIMTFDVPIFILSFLKVLFFKIVFINFVFFSKHFMNFKCVCFPFPLIIPFQVRLLNLYITLYSFPMKV